MFKKITSFLGFAAIICVGVIVSAFYREFQKVDNSDKTISEKLTESELQQKMSQVADELNSGLPKMVDSETRFDRASVGPGPQINYYFSFPNVSTVEIDSKIFLETVKPNFINNICQNSGMRMVLSSGGLVVYEFSGSDGSEIGSLRFSETDCST